jgi:UDP-N-acetylmuramate-alanine ligase
LGVDDPAFYDSMLTFRGASKRLESVTENESVTLFRDFAHAPSKVAATLKAVREQFPKRAITACLELHTYSSLSRDFLAHYRGSMNEADYALVYFNPHTIALKRLPPVTADQVREGFGRGDLEVYSDSRMLHARLNDITADNCVVLMMSSGDFDGLDLPDLGRRLTLTR